MLKPALGYDWQSPKEQEERGGAGLWYYWHSPRESKRRGVELDSGTTGTAQERARGEGWSWTLVLLAQPRREQEERGGAGLWYYWHSPGESKRRGVELDSHSWIDCRAAEKINTVKDFRKALTSMHGSVPCTNGFRRRNSD